MESVLLSTETKTDLKLLLSLAKKLGFNTRVLNAEQVEEIGLAEAINEGNKKDYVNTDEFLVRLKK